MRKSIPNIITLLNLLCGSVAVILVMTNHFVAATIFVFLGIFFDFFDGLAARKLKVQSDLGLQLDSLADMVTSGLVPGLMMYKLISLSTSTKIYSSSDSWTDSVSWIDFQIQPLALFGLLITIASAYRLAKFNIDNEQQSYFKGLPTPANALLILSFPLILEFQNNDIINSTITSVWYLLVVTFLSCYFLNAPFKLFALKFKTWNFADNTIRYVFLILSATLLIVLKFAAIPLIIVGYILLSLFSQKSIM